MIVPMPREVDHHVAGNMSREIDLLAESWHVHRIVFDFAGTDFMDSSGLGLVLGRYRHACEVGAQMFLCNTSTRIQKILSLAGVDKLIKTINRERTENSK